MSWLAILAAARAWRTEHPRAVKLLSELTAILLVLAVVALMLRSAERSAEKRGAAKVTAKVEQRHTAAVADARADEHQAAVSAAAIGAHVSATDAKTDLLVQSELEDLHHALDATPPPAQAGSAADLSPAPVGVLSASINAGVDRANRAADAADAQP